MSRLLHSSSRFRAGASIQAFAFVLLVSSAGVAQARDGLGLGTGTVACQLADTSTLTLLNQTLPIPPLETSGTLDIAVDGQGAVSCNIIEFNPISLVGIGFVCISAPEIAPCIGDCNNDGMVDVGELVTSTNVALGLQDPGVCPLLDPSGDGVAIDDVVGAVGSAIEGCPGNPCPDGIVNCPNLGGSATPIGVDLISDRVIGECTSNEDCQNQCAAYCDELGKVPTDSGFGCEGFCDGGERDGEACVCDAAGSGAGSCATNPDLPDCPGGSCNGADGVAFGNVCECQCVDTSVGDPPAEGAFSCSLGSSIIVERAAPCGDGDILITVGTRCIPLTTASAETVLLSANGLICSGSQAICSTDEDCPEGETCGTGMIGPDMATGNPGTCEGIASGSFSGVGLRGYVNFFGSTIGDLVTKNSVDCQ